jgi:hypothetical protein
MAKRIYKGNLDPRDKTELIVDSDGEHIAKGEEGNFSKDLLEIYEGRFELETVSSKSDD